MDKLTKTIYGGLMAMLIGAFTFISGILPGAAAWTFAGIAQASAVIGTGSLAISAWFRSAADDDNEKVAWALVAMIGILVAVVSIVLAWGGMTFAGKSAVVAVPIVILGAALIGGRR